MRISYEGRNEKCKFRVGLIESDNEEILEKVQHILEDIGWHCSGFDGCFIVSVSDYADYKDLVDDYKEAKRIAKMC